MPFSRPELAVGPDAHAASEARGWVVAALREIGRPDLCDCAELAISELVGNAFLHGSAPITIRLQGTVADPSIEVRDGSLRAPQSPPESFESVATAIAGRGLSLVARASSAWGICLNDNGKVIWFVPSPELSEHGVSAQLTDHRTTAE